MTTAVALREIPILFRAEMIRALPRKTQTRRWVKAAIDEHFDAPVFAFGPGHSGRGWYAAEDDYRDEGSIYLGNRFGEPGDILWCRETWGIGDSGGRLIDPCLNYKADGAQRPLVRAGTSWRVSVAFPRQHRHTVTSGELLKIPERWRAAIHMPRWACRHELERTAPCRIERFGDISEADAIAEGAVCTRDGSWSFGAGDAHPSAQAAFLADVARINKSIPDIARAWCWVVAFKQLET